MVQLCYRFILHCLACGIGERFSKNNHEKKEEASVKVRRMEKKWMQTFANKLTRCTCSVSSDTFERLTQWQRRYNSAKQTRPGMTPIKNDAIFYKKFVLFKSRFCWRIEDFALYFSTRTVLISAPSSRNRRAVTRITVVGNCSIKIDTKRGKAQ